jgi:hypothetical protein
MPKLLLGRPPQQNPPFLSKWNSIKIFDKECLLWSLGIGISVAACVALIWRNCDLDSLPLGSPSWMEFAIVVMVLSVGHETLHMLGFPRFGFDSNTVIGVWPEAGSPYVQYLSPMSRNQFLIAAMFPFLALTILPFMLASYGIGSVEHLSWISVLNSVGAGSDILIVGKLLWMVPNNASVLENGDLLYWGEQSTTAILPDDSTCV